MKEWVWHDPCFVVGYAELAADLHPPLLPQPQV
jgi:hypothetical protein